MRLRSGSINLVDRPSNRPRPIIELHRVCYEGYGASRQVVQFKDWNARFKQAGWNQFNFEVFIWDDFHDRYLISDLCGINLAYGYDAPINPIPSQTTTWTRLDREVRDKIQREFDQVSNVHKLHYRFRVH